ncbi:MAG: Outer membrane protein [Parcubacteria group bacterium GW2011_GWB2_40_8]|nr:MAG: Outer membrane protein [Parcubacteria group bacterium GW2011_GWF2_40_10]KKR47764.1 MAG: Outer membrane protein [Parcubacteria group bacterium GW2011_GWA2_40_143]KKR60098.1 MAG: Outer membrane protein [Parcubacteria group bacterium GW2011_GWC2_40_31]KKR75490.1 MAG: Outer membrane protein [Parcubacteria group bacterium GW2011_GWB2_40_8]KKR77691.1 MAG: Outer membrane protein [Parcubacteria group bacterium GW2011_GWE2_40_8]KKR83116.1 MAG: Outer membrane protein [Parcubacteria group bacteri
MSEKMKRHLGLLGMAMMVASIVAILSISGSYSKSVDPYNARSFSVQGEGKVISVPDVAQFSFSVITQGGINTAEIQKENTEKTNKAIDFLKSLNISEKDIKTQRFDLNPRYESARCYGGYDMMGMGKPCPLSPEIIGYTITQTVSVKIRDFANISKALAGVVENGANNVTSLSFTIDDPDALKAQAREQAIAKAQAKAEAIAKAGGFKIGKLISIYEDYYTPFYSQVKSMGVMDGMGGGESAPMPSIEPGSQEVIVNVNISYQIK